MPSIARLTLPSSVFTQLSPGVSQLPLPTPVGLDLRQPGGQAGAPRGRADGPGADQWRVLRAGLAAADRARWRGHGEPVSTTHKILTSRSDEPELGTFSVPDAHPIVDWNPQPDDEEAGPGGSEILPEGIGDDQEARHGKE